MVRRGGRQRHGDGPAHRVDLDGLVGEVAGAAPQQHRLAAAGGERLLGAEAEHVLLERADEVARAGPVVDGREAAHHRHRRCRPACP